MTISLKSQKAYLICTGPRTGSSMLCELLRQSKLVGFPKEYFNINNLNNPEMRLLLGIEPDESFVRIADWFGRIVTAGTGKNEVFGAKVHAHDFNNLISTLRDVRAVGTENWSESVAMGDLVKIWKELRIIRLKRKNTVAQAISHYRAIQTSVWYINEDEPEKINRNTGVSYEYEKIHTWVNFVQHENTFWDTFLREYEGNILTIEYEDLCAALEKTMNGIISYLGVDTDTTINWTVRSLKQADQQSLEWEQQYRNERRLCGAGEVGDYPYLFTSAAVINEKQHHVSTILPFGKKRRICLVTSEVQGLFRNGGIGTAMTGLAMGLAKCGHDITVIFVNTDGSRPRDNLDEFVEQQAYYRRLGIKLDFVRPPVEVESAPNDPRIRSYSVYGYLRKQKFDCVVFAENGGLGYYSLEAKRCGLWTRPPQLFVVAHGSAEWVRELNSRPVRSLVLVATDFLERRSAELADVLISPSQYLLDWMAHKGWKMPARTDVIQNIHPVAEQLSAATDSKGSTKITEIVFFGRLETRKGLVMFCDAIDLLHRENEIDGVRVTILGKFDEVDGRHSGLFLAERIKRWNCLARILTTYDQPEALRYISRPGVLAVMPSFAENSPCVVMECIEAGIPFIASDGGGTKELVAMPDRPGCLFAPDLKSLTAALRRVFAEGSCVTRPAMERSQTLARWRKLFEDTPPQPKIVERAERYPGLISVCISGCLNEAETALSAINTQQNIRFEVIFVDTCSGISTLDIGSVSPHCRVISCPALGLAEARNTAVREARGEYLVFMNSSDILVDPDVLSQLVTACRCSGSDIVTGLNTLDAKGALDTIPIGGCLQLGVIENCFGGVPLIVSTEQFRRGSRFTEDREIATDWAYLSHAVLAGMALTVLPRKLTRPAAANQTQADLLKISQARRSVIAGYSVRSADILGDALEALCLITDRSRVSMEGLQTFLEKNPSATANKLTLLSPNGPEAERAFVSYCWQNGLYELAEDYSILNKIHDESDFSGKSHQITARTTADFVSYNSDESCQLVDLTETFRTVLSMHYRSYSDNKKDELISLKVDNSLSVVKIEGGCPLGTKSLKAFAGLGVDSSASVRFAIAVSPCGVEISEQQLADGTTLWSGWMTTNSTVPQSATVCFEYVIDQSMDLYLMARVRANSSVVSSHISWLRVEAEIGG